MLDCSRMCSWLHFPVLLWSRSRRALALWASVMLMMLWFQYGILTLEGRPDREMDSLSRRPASICVARVQRGPAVCGEVGRPMRRRWLLAILLTANVLNAYASQDANGEQLKDFKATAAAIRVLPSDKPVFVGEGELGFSGHLPRKTASVYA